MISCLAKSVFIVAARNDGGPSYDEGIHVNTVGFECGPN